jgi:hypothetical protein
MSKHLSELFTVRNGVPATSLNISDVPVEGYIPFIRPSKTRSRSIAGWIDPSTVDEKHIYPVDTLYVSTNGEGSHSYSYVSTTPFVANSDVAILIPKSGMTFNEKSFYAMCITANRPMFSYGRKPKGKRLASIKLPEVVPEWVHAGGKVALGEISSELGALTGLLYGDGELGDVEKDDGTQRVDDLFDLTYGHSLELVALEQSDNESAVNFISRTAANNGISARVTVPSSVVPQPAGALTVALGGSVLETFVQPESFVCGRDVMILTPKDSSMSYVEKMWWAHAIKANQYKYSYGRQANRTLASIKLPAAVPAWVSTVTAPVLSDANDKLEVLSDSWGMSLS